jgi:hypothetical protein
MGTEAMREYGESGEAVGMTLESYLATRRTARGRACIAVLVADPAIRGMGEAALRAAEHKVRLEVAVPGERMRSFKRTVRGHEAAWAVAREVAAQLEGRGVKVGDELPLRDFREVMA